MGTMGQRNMHCTKWTVFGINLIFSLLGLTLLIGGTAILFIYQHHEYFTAAQIRSVPVIFIIFGFFSFVFAILGAFGAIAKSSCLTYFSSIVIILLLISQMGLLAFGSLNPKAMNTFWNSSFNDMLENHEAHKETWDFMQNQLECCGVNGPGDWISMNMSGTLLPASCCPSSNRNNCTELVAFKFGCKPALFNYFDNNSWILFSLIIVIMLIQMLLFGLSCSLYGTN